MIRRSNRARVLLLLSGVGGPGFEATDSARLRRRGDAQAAEPKGHVMSPTSPQQGVVAQQ